MFMQHIAFFVDRAQIYKSYLYPALEIDVLNELLILYLKLW